VESSTRARSVSNIDLQSIRHGDPPIRAGLRIFDLHTGKGHVVSFVAEVFEDATIVLLNIKDMPEDAARAIAGLEEVIHGSDGEGGKSDIGRLKKIRLTGKIPALEGLARHLGMFQDERTTLQQAFQIVIHVGDDE
jgi:hypothetical protein